mgnify:CR=1 FL=1
MSKFGIKIDKIKDQELFQLLSIGNTAAKIVLEERYKRDIPKKTKLNNQVSKLESKGIRFNSFYKELGKFKVLAILITPKKICEQMPLKALANPFLNETLNNKLGDLYWKETLIDHAKQIKRNKLAIEEENFTTADINKIRFSILWLNFELSNRSSFSNPEMLLSKDARKVFRKEGFKGLLRIAKTNKKYFERIFSRLNELENKDFFNKASMEFHYVWFKKFTATDRHKFINAIDALYLSGQKKFLNYPIYYLYHKKSISIDKLRLLYDISYRKVRDVIFISAENSRDIFEKEVFWQKCNNSFSKFKS